MNQDEIDGKATAFKGKVKQVAGDLTDDQKLKEDGQADEVAGKVQDGIGRARRKVGETIEDVGKAFKK
ncbi:MAG: CsbD family protein [Acidobacteriota bacterium]